MASSSNGDKIDYLTEDPIMADQKFVCLSVFTPDTLVASTAERVTLRDKHTELVKAVFAGLGENAELKAKFTELVEVSKKLLDTRRAIKIRGSYESFEAAQKRCEKIRSFDPHFNVFVGEVGKWLPWEDNPENARDVVYAESELNKIMKQYHEEQEKSRMYHEERKNAMIQQAIKENEKKKEEVKKKEAKKAVSAMVSEAIEASASSAGPSSAPSEAELLEKLKLEAQAVADAMKQQ